MKEEEAKTKWCPHVRQPIETGEYNGSFNRGEGDDPANIEDGSLSPCNCIASDCMMWRWSQYSSIRTSEPVIESGGFCGLTRNP